MLSPRTCVVSGLALGLGLFGVPFQVRCELQLEAPCLCGFSQMSEHRLLEGLSPAPLPSGVSPPTMPPCPLVHLPTVPPLPSGASPHGAPPALRGTPPHSDLSTRAGILEPLILMSLASHPSTCQTPKVGQWRVSRPSRTPMSSHAP